ncbi:hypothetical protein IU405_07225 [Polaribacter sp. BAL334]|uniref:hypothetical protein n=1 Tax=Polaribacter sp. BAL334 TaxID=1708178 RepID=UPI0018D2441D|nr:hypothetical protein [Polaribacter sp. BAL334]MBG7612037.1 hypothetical protein [Polaribacter sp. BAL334]
MEIIWTRLANNTFTEIFENLDFRWTKKEMKEFRNLTDSMLENIKNEKISHSIIIKRLEIRKAVLHRNVSLYYKIDRENNKIYVLTFFNNRMNPRTLQKLLN